MKILPLEIFYIYFSPYTAHAIEVDGVTYMTVEHAYQCTRYTDQKIKDEIMRAGSPVKAWETSTKYKHLQIPEFKSSDYKRAMMKKLMKLKALQHEEVKKALLETGKQKIVKHILTYPPGDGYWDDGVDGKGQNEMGKIWMEIRDELK
jgi:ribA/ribD-fused uncharacterized protein